MATQQKNSRFVLVALLLFIALVVSGIWAIYLGTQREGADSQTGVWDLRDSDPNDLYVRIDGKAQVAPNLLLTPREFAAREDEFPPGTSKDLDYATTRMRFLLPEGEYMLMMRSNDFSNRIYLNGRLAEDIGVTGTTAEDTVEATRYYYTVVSTQNGVIELVQQSANFVHREAGNHPGFYLATPALGRMYLARQENVRVALMGCYLALFIAHTALFVMLRQNPANIYFALFCLVWMLRAGVIDPKVISTMFPGIPWQVLFRVEYLAVPLGGMLVLLCLYHLFPGLVHRWFMVAVGAIMGASVLVFLFTPSLFMVWFLPVPEVLVVAAGAYFMARVVFRLRRPDEAQMIIIGGTVLLLYATVHDMLYFYGVYIFPRVGNTILEPVIVIFIFFQMVAIFYRTTQEVATIRARQQLLDASMAMQAQRFEEITGHINEVKVQRHDMRHHMRLLGQMLEKGEVDGAIDYLREYQSSTGADSVPVCGNFLADLVMQHYLQQARQQGIRMETLLDIPPKPGIDDMDLCIVLGNLVENALHACMAMAPRQGFISVSVQAKGEELMFAVDNSCLATQPSGARPREGLGMSSVRMVAKKYGGIATFAEEEGMFRASVLLNTAPGLRLG